MITAIVRQRGQLTIPDKIRDVVAWLREGEIISIEIEQENVILKPHTQAGKQTPNWDKIWHNIELARSFKGKRGNLSQMIAEDRENH
ncbi:MAG: hypothetical protein A2804_02015 [Candidatus Pacebacteria bacterium RIFCSPHIGHO2_01_FULL_46_10]|nr:MAG: hypothetical protein A2804_02015 [Candidatus Pacebacteria bacterium RIFCSPHIGHO2_01_FULL_46_10]